MKSGTCDFNLGLRGGYGRRGLLVPCHMSSSCIDSKWFNLRSLVGPSGDLWLRRRGCVERSHFLILNSISGWPATNSSLGLAGTTSSLCSLCRGAFVNHSFLFDFLIILYYMVATPLISALSRNNNFFYADNSIYRMPQK
jgi:hypothetical protein